MSIVNTVIMCVRLLFYLASTLLGYHPEAIEHPIV